MSFFQTHKLADTQMVIDAWMQEYLYRCIRLQRLINLNYNPFNVFVKMSVYFANEVFSSDFEFVKFDW